MREYRERIKRALSTLATRYAQLWSAPQSTPPAPTTTGTALDAVNEQFHAAHLGARHAAKHDDPVLVVLGDDLIMFHRRERTSYSFSPTVFHVLKSVAHAPVALYALCENGGDAGFSTGLAALQKRTRRGLDELSSHEHAFDGALRDDVRFVLERTCQTAADLQKSAARASTDEFAASVGPALLRLAHAATRIQLAALHQHTQRLLADLSPEQRAVLHVVVAGDHQARARSLPMQYFKKLLGEPEALEQRVTYAEGVHDERAAFDLVGTQRLDRRLARAFFGDEKRLQRDILGDAAAAELNASALPGLG
jgi:hypothetical protein